MLTVSARAGFRSGDCGFGWRMITAQLGVRLGSKPPHKRSSHRVDVQARRLAHQLASTQEIILITTIPTVVRPNQDLRYSRILTCSRPKLVKGSVLNGA